MAKQAGGAVVAVFLLAGCGSRPEPAGVWQRRADIFFCDWEGGHNQGRMSFARDGNFSEQLDFEATERSRPFSTSAKGQWSIVGETLTLDLNQLAGHGEQASPSERMRLMFTAAQQSNSLMLTLTTIVHEDADQPSHVIDVPKAERCTVVYERVPSPHPWRNALAAFGFHS